MTDFPIVPPPELIRQWMEKTEYDADTWFYESYIAEQAAQWGVDQFKAHLCRSSDYRNQLALKEQAFTALEDGKDGKWTLLTSSETAIIRQALEILHD